MKTIRDYINIVEGSWWPSRQNSAEPVAPISTRSPSPTRSTSRPSAYTLVITPEHSEAIDQLVKSAHQIRMGRAVDLNAAEIERLAKMLKTMSAKAGMTQFDSLLDAILDDPYDASAPIQQLATAFKDAMASDPDYHTSQYVRRNA